MFNQLAFDRGKEGRALLGPCRDPFRDRLRGLNVQEMTDAGDDLHRLRGGEPMSVVDLRGEDAAVDQRERIAGIFPESGGAEAGDGDLLEQVRGGNDG